MKSEKLKKYFRLPFLFMQNLFRYLLFSKNLKVKLNLICISYFLYVIFIIASRWDLLYFSVLFFISALFLVNMFVFILFIDFLFFFRFSKLFLLRRICLLYFVLIISFLKFRFLFSFKFQLPTLVLACLLCDYKHILYENII